MSRNVRGAIGAATAIGIVAALFAILAMFPAVVISVVIVGGAALLVGHIGWSIATEQ